MTRGNLIRTLLGNLALALPLGALAQQAQTTDFVNLRTGPARGYPLVQQLPPETQVMVQGCLSDYRWCDVLVPGNVRGWVDAGYLIAPFQSGALPLNQSGRAIGLPIVGFRGHRPQPPVVRPQPPRPPMVRPQPRPHGDAERPQPQ